MSAVERIKAASHALRGDIAAELAEPTSHFSEASGQILKFHGIYQQDDRDRRREARQLGLDKAHMMMIRTRIPGGVMSAAAYLAHDRIATEWGNGTLRVTTRQDFQLHGVLKGDLRASIRAINATLLTTLGGCGDQVRNILCCPAPLDDRLRAGLQRILPELVAAVTPVTRAYTEIWLDGDLAASTEPEPAEDPLYGRAYLPRKFKAAVAIAGDNCIDVYANDLGLVARAGAQGSLDGFDVLVGGGLGRTANKPATRPYVSQALGFVPASGAAEVVRAVVSLHRDHGDRANRRHARLKYLIADRGLEWFRERVDERLSAPLQAPRPLLWESAADHLGWQAQGDGRHFYGLFVENGRIADTPEHRLRSALRDLVSALGCEVRLTAQQNLLLVGLDEDARDLVLGTLRGAGVTPSEAVPVALRTSMACPAYPTCGLAVAESERVLPSLIREIGVLQAAHGLADQPISYRMTGCPNGCARPYLGDVGLVGTTLGKYDVFLGGDTEGTRLNELFARNVRLEDIAPILDGLLAEYARSRAPAEGFGDWCRRTGIDALVERHQLRAVGA
ncbi:MAG: NADPH-dependent assimilatory sulfite reductase hemoprotein subunit [Candidatus Dormibacteria bacterium]